MPTVAGGSSAGPPVEPGAEAGDNPQEPADAELFDRIAAAGNYVGAAAVLAGFCFTAVVLIVNLEEKQPGAFDRAIGALLTAFLGLVLAGFLQAVVAGQPVGDRRTSWLALLAGLAMATSALFALWGVCELIGVVYSGRQTGPRGERLVDLVALVFVTGSVAITALVTHVAVNLRRLAGYDPRDAWTVAVLWQLFAVCVTEAAMRSFLEVRPDTSITRIAVIQLGGVLVVVITTLLLASWRDAEAPKRSAKRDSAGAFFTYFLCALPAALAWALLARLPDNPLL